MGICEKKSQTNLVEKSADILNKNPLQKRENNHCYKFKCYEKNIINEKDLNLQYYFSKIKIRHCISHSPTKNSTYITEVSIGQNSFKLNINQGRKPIINESMIFQIQKDFTMNELEETYLLIYVYEFIGQININMLNSLNKLPEDLKRKCEYISYFKMDLLSFLFKSRKCDFKMMGEKQLSANTRICFICDIKHRTKIKIEVKSEKLKNYKLILKDKNKNQSTIFNSTKNNFELITPPLTMNEFQKVDLFLETNENELAYKYITLNDLKFLIIKKLGKYILKEEKDNNELELDSKDLAKNIYLESPKLYNNFHNGNKFDLKNILTESKQDITLTCENLPFVAQISSLYFTEFNHLYNTSLLHMINNDIDIYNYCKSFQNLSENFYNELLIIYEKLNIANLDFKPLISQLNDILIKSADNEKLYFLYQNTESLCNMIIILMKIGIKIISFTERINDEERLNILVGSIYNLILREELDNSVIYYCLKSLKTMENNLKNIYTNFYISLLRLNGICSKKSMFSTNIILVEIYSNLYFTKKIVRQTIFNIFPNEEPNENHEIDNYIYDIATDEFLRENLDQKLFDSLIQKKYYFFNLFQARNIFFKSIVIKLINININEYPFDFTQFSDNQNILNILGRYIKNKKIDNLENEIFEIADLLSGSYETINKMNNNLISFTNGYNNNAVFLLFDYLKNLLEYYYAKEGDKLIMDYALIEQATNLLIDLNSSISLPKLFWFYYYCSHLIISGHLKHFIINLCNNKDYFDKFAFHWAFAVRQIFFKLIIFIFNNRLKNEEGKFFDQNNMKGFINKDLKNKLYFDESLKDYNIINEEFAIWKSLNGLSNLNKEYPMVILPLPNTDNLI